MSDTKQVRITIEERQADGYWAVTHDDVYPDASCTPALRYLLTQWDWVSFGDDDMPVRRTARKVES